MELNSYNGEQRILITVGCILLGFDGEQLKVLLAQKELSDGKSIWSVMEGFIRPEETSEDAASSLLYQVTSKTNVYMEQLHTLSAVDSDPSVRVISIVYFALTNVTDYNVQLPLPPEKKWFSLNELPPMTLEYRDMILKTHARLRDKIETHTLGFELLPKKFTISQLKSLYEAIYGCPLDRRNFIKKMQSLGFLKKLNEKEKVSSRKGAFYYVVNATEHSTFESAVAKCK
jgi:ADP-ribose pyrophosphatase YjhB (NUDIX family)